MERRHAVETLVGLYVNCMRSRYYYLFVVYLSPLKNKESYRISSPAEFVLAAVGL